MRKILKNRMLISVSLSVVLTFIFVFAAAYSATTISTNVSTDGTLTVTGAVWATSTLQVTDTFKAYGNATVGGTLGVTGVTTLINASTTNITNSGNLWVNGFATTTGSNGNIATEGTLTVGGAAAITGAVRASSTLQVTDNLWSYSKIGAGTSTPIAEISATSTSATTTLYLHSDSSTKGGCIQVEGVDGAVYRMVPGDAAAATTTGGRAGFTAWWEVGACK